MNIQQLEYIVAVDNRRHFAKAAEDCRVSQPTLSMMIQKLEEELDVRLFDRLKHPIEPTPVGEQVIRQARVSLRNVNRIKEIVDDEKETVKGTFTLGVIPTIAPYLVPELLRERQTLYNEVELILKEYPTHRIIEELSAGTLDGGLLAGPLRHPEIVEHPIYYEQFYAYVSKEDIYREKEIDLDSIDINRVWLLENVHCLRGQIERLCRMKRQSGENTSTVRYEAGSIDTLMNIVDCNYGMTVIPEMSAMGLSEERQDNLRKFKNVTPVREVSLAVGKDYVRKNMLNIVADIIRQSVPKSMLDASLKAYLVEL